MTTQAEKTEKIRQFNLKQQQQQQTQEESDTTKTNQEKIAEDKERRKQEALAEQARLRQEKASKNGDNTNEEVDENTTEDTLNLLTDTTSYMIDRINAQVNPLKQWISSQPTPGGIGALLIFIAFLALAIIPVNAAGQTRLYLFWNTLVGRTHMKYRENMNVGASSTQQSGGNTTSAYSVNLDTGASTLNNNTGSTNGTVTTGMPLSFQHLNLFGSSEV